MFKVPKIIHQTWEDENIPKTMKNYVKSWKEKNPDYQYILWTADKRRQLIKDHYRWFLPYFDSYPHQIMRVDVFKLFVLHCYGGVYADLDMECYKCIDPLLSEGSALLFLEWPGSISNAIMAASPGHPLMEYCFKELVNKHVIDGSISKVFEITGPKFLTETVNKYGYQDYKLYPSIIFFPIPWHKPAGDQSGKSKQYPNSFGAHHWQGTWWQKQPMHDNFWWWVLGGTLLVMLFLLVLWAIAR